MESTNVSGDQIIKLENNSYKASKIEEILGEDNFVCGVCFEHYNVHDKIPYILTSCGHTFCKVCIDDFHKKSFSCPLDIEPQKDNPVKNFALLSMITNLEKKKEEEIKNCSHEMNICNERKTCSLCKNSNISCLECKTCNQYALCFICAQYIYAGECLCKSDGCIEEDTENIIKEKCSFCGLSEAGRVCRTCLFKTCYECYLQKEIEYDKIKRPKTSNKCMIF
mmetsp:Transcript_35360/g.36745  ORF Transcript_35360/g.36745 Transcript_35360/m.36745 type:complete len:223 (-) Transcript_35360:21-689(-)